MQIASVSAITSISSQPSPDKLATRNASVKQKSNETNKLELLLIKIGEELFAIRALQVLRLLRATSIQTPTQPAAHPALIGLVEGVGLPVFDLGRLLNLEMQASTSGDQILIIENNMRVIGLRVNTVNEVIRVSLAELAPLPAIVELSREKPVAWALLFNKDIPVILIEPGALLTEHEWQMHAVIL